ncbi:MAG TPA: ADP-polyphosphate phosphotransferase [Gammaproteobacteria bacterium]
MAAIKTKGLRVKPGGKLDLEDWPTRIEPVYGSTQRYREILESHVSRLSELQQLLYASERYAVLFIFQAMDAAGKDGAISHVMSGVNPQGCHIRSFKRPSEEELKHDFLWRASRDLPERGYLGIFNRSYYEEVLVTRVHPQLLRGEGVKARKVDQVFWAERYHAIREFERHLHEDGTRVVKFYLHLSKEEQRKRLLARLDDPQKNWKFNPDDLEERGHWKDYMRAYADCLAATSTKDAPWYVIPADDKENARLLISQVAVDTLAGLKMSYPKLDAGRRKELKAARKQLSKKGA